MAETQHFAMEALVWELLYSDKQGVHSLQNRLSRLTNDRLINEINERLEKIVPASEQISFDRLELDLGNVLLQDIETELPGRLIEALSEQVNLYLEVRRKNATDDAEDEDQTYSIVSAESLLTQLLETGLLPWWVSADQRKELAALVRELLETDKERLGQILRNIGAQEPVRRRLAYQLPESLIEEIIQVLEPAEAEYIIGYHYEVVKIQQQEQPVKTESAGFSRALWYFILQYLLDDRGSEFNRKEFAERTLRQIAANYSIAYFELLRLLYAAVKETIAETNRAIALEKLLEQLAIEASVQTRFPLQPQLTDIDGIARDPQADILWQQLNLVAYFLQFGSLPPGAAGYSADDLSAMVTRLAETIPQHFMQMMQQIWRMTDFSERYVRLLGREKIKQVFGSIAQARFDAIWQMSTLMDVFDRQYHLFDQAGTEWSRLKWKLVLHTFFISVDNTLAEKDSIGLLLRAFAAQTSLNYAGLLSAVQQKMNETFRFGIHDSELPRWINELEAGQHEQKIADIFTEIEQENEVRATGYLDILYFLVEFGYMPWWAASSLKEKSLENWILISADTVPVSVKTLLEWAGRLPVYRERLVQVLPAEVLTQWLSLLPQGKTLIKRAVAAIRFIEQFYQSSGYNVTKRVLQAFWEDLVWNEYRYFRTPAVFSLALQKIARDRGLTWQSIVLSISGKLNSSSPVSAEDAAFAQIVQRLALAAWDAPVETMQNDNMQLQEQTGVWQHHGFQKRFQLFFAASLSEGVKTSMPEMQEETGLLDYLTQADILLRNRMGEVSNFLLQYFLIWGRLPDEFRSITANQQHIFIRQLLIMAFTADRNNLQTLLLDKRFSAPAIQSLQGHIQESRGGVDKQMSDWLGHIKKEEEIFMPIPVPGSADISPESVREELFKWLASDGVLSDAVLHNRVRQILDDFFATGQLPLTLPPAFRDNLSGRLGALLLLLFNENRLLLHALLQQPYHLPAARIWLQELLRNETDSQVQQLISFMEPYQSIYWRKQMVLEERMTGKQEMLEKLAPEKWVEQLTRFLRSDFVADDQPDENTLRILLRLIYKHDQTVLLAILESGESKQSARLQLYDIIEGTTDRQEQKIYESWRQLIEKDMAEITSRLEHLPVSESGTPSSVIWVMQQTEEKGADFLYQVLEHSSIQWQATHIDFFRQMEQLLTGQITDIFFHQYIRKMYYSFLAELATGRTQTYGSEDFIRKYTAYFFGKNTAIPGKFLQEWVDNIATGDTHVLQQNELEYFVQMAGERLREKNADGGRIAPVSENIPANGTKESIQEELDQHIAEREQSSADNTQPDKEEPVHKIYIRNAGLVLMHPFLNTYFSRLGLVAEGKFVSEDARHRAVMLLFYLVFGRTDAEEHELPLNKLLCGVSILDPVPLVFEPTEEEKAVTEELFQVIFQRWEKMKNSSVAGFRASFLQREGALQKEEEAWALRVEQRAYDLLLDTLPWAFGMIKLPWMEKILTVVWT